MSMKKRPNTKWYPKNKILSNRARKTKGAYKLGIATLSLAMGASQAEVITDGSMGAASNISLDTNNTYTIPQSLGTTQQNNLFHSFSNFNIETGNTADFTGAANIQNIFNRITGGSPSNIDGTLRSSIARANLYLINPYGVMFGANATLDITGSFYATTADKIVFADGQTFDALENTTPVSLSIAPVEAFGFTGETPANIDVQGQLQVGTDQSIGLIGGDINITGATITTDGGQIQLNSIGGRGEIKSNTDLISLDDNPQWGQISIDSQSEIDVSGDVAGQVVIRGGTFTLTTFSNMIANTQGTGINTYSNNVDIETADNINIDFFSNISTSVNDLAGTDSAGITLKAKAITLSQDSKLDSNTGVFSLGNGGDIELLASDIVLDSNAQISSSTGAISLSQGGDISFNADNITIKNRASITSETQGSGNSGTINLSAKNKIELTDGKITTGTGRETGAGGNISITADTLNHLQSSIFTTSTNSAKGGDISINTKRTLLSNYADIYTQTTNSGDSGDITINTDFLSITDGGDIATAATADGQNGSLVINTTSILIRGFENSDSPFSGPDFTGVFTQSSNSDQGGPLTISNGESIKLLGRAKIVTFADGTGNGGDLLISSNSIDVLEGSNISTQTNKTGKGGDLIIQAESLNVDGIHDQITFISDTLPILHSSKISSINDAGNLTGVVGDINIDADEINILNGGEIISNSGTSLFNSGNIVISGKNITVSGINTQALEIILPQLKPELKETVIQDTSSHIRATSNLPIPSPTTQTGGKTITISSENLALDNGGYISGETRGEHNSANIEIASSSLKITQGSYITATDNQGAGLTGNISIEAESILVDGKDSEFVNSGIYTSTNEAGTNKGGDIEIITDKLWLSNDAMISSEVHGKSTGGNISIDSQKTFLVKGATVTARATTDGNAGNISLISPLLVLSNGHILTSAITGHGGNIDIFTNNLISAFNSTINASSEQSIDGTININTDFESIDNLEKLQETPSDQSPLLRSPCDQNENNKSRFYVSNTNPNIQFPHVKLDITELNNKLHQFSCQKSL